MPVKTNLERGFKMKELTIVLDSWGHKELKDYLMSLKGISKVIVEDERYLKIYVKYNPTFITLKMIKMEILLFLDILKIPSIIAFDKHFQNKTSGYQIVRKDICCEYCFKSSVEELFDIKGIEKVESNFDIETYDNNKEIVINVTYDSSLINASAMKEIEIKLNL